ncbi:hypothetical protein [Geodermatophilus sp. URMC 63]
MVAADLGVAERRTLLARGGLRKWTADGTGDRLLTEFVIKDDSIEFVGIPTASEPPPFSE